MSTLDTGTIFQLKISLKRAKPPIWRRVLVPGDVTFATLHKIIQCAMGWYDVHLHEFHIGDVAIGTPDPYNSYKIHDEHKIRLNEIVSEPKDRISYTYDFGDDWAHQIVLEKLLPRDDDTEYPLCIKGKRACPPEDVGGIWGYEDFLLAYFDPAHPEHEEVIDWAGEGFDPESFDMDYVNARLQHVLSDATLGGVLPHDQMPDIGYGGNPLQTAGGPRGSESIMRKITQLLEGQDFSGIDDMNAFLSKTLSQGSIDDLVPDTIEDQAMALLDQAYKSDDSRQRIKLAREALDMCPTCVDAYIVLANEEEDPHTAVSLLEQGVQVAVEALGPDTFVEDEGHFWGVFSTRPYMRVRWALARTLWHVSRGLEAVAHAEDLLRLNPGDNMGVRDDLLFWYLTMQDTDGAEELLIRFDDEIGCLWPLGRALCQFQIGGDSQSARQELLEAFTANKHLMNTFLLTDELEFPDSYSFGSAEEAVLAVMTSMQAFIATEGALSWLYAFIRELTETSPRRTSIKVGRNEPCPCGSGVKYKRCCGSN